ncbi:MAG: hypothetical protein ACM3OO_00290 [Planctomycetaceae bacterium]
MRRRVAAAALALAVLTACGGTTSDGGPSTPGSSQSPAAVMVMAALCRLQTMPAPTAQASAVFFSVHDTLHGLAAQLDDAGRRAVAADVLQATAAVEAHVEGTETSVPWPTATRNLVTTIQGAYATLGEQAPTCS